MIYNSPQQFRRKEREIGRSYTWGKNLTSESGVKMLEEVLRRTRLPVDLGLDKQCEASYPLLCLLGMCILSTAPIARGDSRPEL